MVRVMGKKGCAECAGGEKKKNKTKDYVPCIYELSYWRKKKDKHPDEKNWRARILWSIGLYFFLVSMYFLVIGVFGAQINDTEPYSDAVWILASVIFWPLIVMYDADLYYKTCGNLKCMLKSEYTELVWYSETAERYFGFTVSEKSKGWYGALLSIFCIVVVVCVYVLKIYMPSFVPVLLGKPWIPFIAVFISGLVVYLEKRRRNLNLTLFVMCCGFAYYVYVSFYSAHSLQPLFTHDFWVGQIILFILIGFFFFIAGTTISPMLGLFRVFFLNNFEEMIEYPVDEVACSLDKIQSIKSYFWHLTGVNLFAYFQLLGSAYLMGLLSTDSVMTKVLFFGGSFFPLAMYLAASVFYKKLCHKVYLLQVKHIDHRIYEEMKNDTINADQAQVLIALKEMYANEFEVHAAMNKEILIAMITPIITAVVALFIPGQ